MTHMPRGVMKLGQVGDTHNYNSPKTMPDQLRLFRESWN